MPSLTADWGVFLGAVDLLPGVGPGDKTRNALSRSLEHETVRVSNTRRSEEIVDGDVLRSPRHELCCMNGDSLRRPP